MKKSTIILTVMLLNLAAVFGQTNVALKRSITNTYFEGYTANVGNAVDNDVSTYFGAAGSSTGKFITIDLGSVFPINSVKLFYSLTPQSQQIFSSLDGINFTLINTSTVVANSWNDIAITTYPNNINKHQYIRVAFLSTTGSVNIKLNEVQIICNSCITMAYSYDGQGNRISRTITLPPPGLKAATAIYDSTTQALNKEFIPENTFTDAVGDSKVSIYPNPTRGELVVQVTSPNADATHGIMLFDANGALIYQKENATEYTDVDITNKPTGIYILKILNGENSTTWKIIKQ